MFIFSVNSVEANRSVLNSINPDDGVSVELKSLPKCVGFEEWDRYEEIRVIQQFEVDFGIAIPVVFAVQDGAVVDARVIVAEAL